MQMNLICLETYRDSHEISEPTIEAPAPKEPEISDEREQELDDIASEVDSESESTDDYLQSEHCSYAYDIGYYATESDLDDIVRIFRDECTDDERFDDLIEGKDSDDIAKLIIDNSEVSFTDGYHCRDFEVYSMPIGEYEHQIEDQLSDKLKALTEAEFKYVARQTRGCYLRCHEYLYCGSESWRWSLIADEDKVFEALEAK